mmetsp:Transcript_25381/g.46020  ORF Transcript_25381/g.46020 Transcript_25381/m.46020 type:complete len:728 (-) Transcript_25381:246-2429(-)|eukprot:CAMPEP_0197661030 /NCGR_PEP_ID=MMETSP1338-20131121/51202_1 /TAXON_ID=43686 ORGANISM="Pelagodinium beii, Strain RCC1491" /NCGR_SAMPLE_ID=MMETSP1338 /ASSEMBLY_ACC=CAM_ASM_000754 /LENGTH=727 /DNA_ID=CAMNT_0043238497 /DNA_START=45 /DNA_END=2228 /DNA_ORIENTATION=+
MVDPVGLLTLVSTLGTSIQSFFSWVGYNRDSFGMNVGWRQSHLYQTKNYYANWIGFARDDLTTLKGASVHHTANYMMVASTVLSSTILALLVAGFNGTCPAFVVLDFYTSAALAVMFSTLSIMFGVKTQGSAYENTCMLLTSKLRPYTPSSSEHRYLNQAQHIERLGLGSLLRKPGTEDSYGVHVNAQLEKFAEFSKKLTEKLAQKDAEKPPNDDQTPSTQDAPLDVVVPMWLGKEEARTESSQIEEDSNEDPKKQIFANIRSHTSPETHSIIGQEGDTAFEVLEEDKSAEYLSAFHELLELWKPHEEYCKLCMGLGTVCFLDSACSFLTGKVIGYSEYFDEHLLGVTVVLCLPSIGILITLMNAYEYAGIREKMLQAGSMVTAALAAAWQNPAFQALTVPVSHILRVAFWSVVIQLVGKTFLERHVENELEKEEMEEEDVESDSEASKKLGTLRYEFFSKEDVNDFRDRAAKKRLSGHKIVARAICVCVAMMFSMVTWSLAHHAVLPFLEAQLAESSRPTVNLEELDVQWPSPLFQPHDLACGGGQIFTSDGYNIFELFPSGSAVRVACSLGNHIKAISSICKESCRPVALLEDGVSDCTELMALRGDSRQAQFLAVLSQENSSKLFTVHGDEVVQYRREMDSWHADYSIRKVDPAALRGVDAFGDIAMLYQESGQGRLEILSLDGHLQEWRIPQADIVGFCMINQHETLVLAMEGQPSLFRGRLA